MQKYMFRLWLTVIVALIVSVPCVAQVATGTPPLSVSGGGPDVIDLANLNSHISIPVVNKAGRGTPFYYNLSYDSSIWYPNGGVWVPVQNLGWRGDTEISTGYLVYQTIESFCYTNPGHTLSGTLTTYNGFGYHDSFGVSHGFHGSASSKTGTCGTGPTGLTAVAEDGSGYTLNYLHGGCRITSKGGRCFYPPENSSSGAAGTATDANGNEISVTAAGVFTDTLGTTAISVSGTAPSPTTFTYTAPNGSPASFTMNYSPYTLRTNFGCTGVSEYGPTTNVYLVSSISLPDGTSYSFTYEPTPGFSGDVTGRLASVTYPTGGTITYIYSGGTGTGSSGIVCADGSTATLKRTTPDTGANSWTYAHSESGTAWTTTVTDPQSNQTVLNFQGIYETERQVNQGASTLLKTVTTCYNGNTSSCNSTAITLPITQKTVFRQWPGGLESRTDDFYNAYGLATEKDEYGYGSGAPGALARKTLTTYATLTNGIVNKPATITVQDGSGNTKSQATYTYDQGSVTATSGTPQQVAISGSRGNATTISYLVGSTSLTKTFTYYDTGTVNVATDVNGAATTYTYGTSSCGNSFPTSASEPLSLSKSMTWNCTGGVQASATDENSQPTTYAYTTDPDFWRPNSVTDAASNVTNFTYSGAITSDSALNFNGTTSTLNMLATRDGLGRSQLSQKRESPSSTTYDSVETDYDQDGRPSRTTLPFQASAGTLNSTAPGTTTTYDALGRKTQLSTTGGESVTYTYSQNDVYRTMGPAPTGENTKRKQLEYDALGRLTSVCEISSALPGVGSCAQTATATGYWTKYTYDPLNHLLTVTQNAQSGSQQTRTFVYDDLGRMISEINPESGTTSYTYDSDATCGITSKGDLIKKVDAVGNTTCTAYDLLHRPTSVTYTGTYSSSSPIKHFVYDSATVNSVAMANAKARMAEAYTCVSPCTTKITDIGISYTVLGQPADVYESTPHSSGYYHVTASYWANGVLDQLKNLAGLPTITYGVDGEGRVTSASAASGQNPLSSTSYNTASQPTQINLGSSDSDSLTYDPNTNRETKYQFTVNSQSVVGQLTWNSIGTLETLAITDPFYGAGNQTCTYAHDDISRIASVNCGSPWSQTFGYDSFGNLTKSGSMSFAPTYSYLTNHMTQIGSSTPTYDANGNVTNDFLHTYTWDAAGRPVTMDTVIATYDALGRMVEQNKSGVYTEIAYAPGGGKLALMTGQTLQKAFVPLPGGSVAVYTSSGLAYYRHSDWVGSSRFASTPTRTMYSDGAYGPFGEGYAQTGSTDMSFTGMNQDTVSNLYDFAAREYGTQGRWPSPDPSGSSSVSPDEPQTWNRYAYVTNNPMSYVDSTGMARISPSMGMLLSIAGMLGFGSGPAFGADPFNFGSGPVPGTCVYLNADGTGVDQQYGNGVDTNSNSTECAANAGYFAPGNANAATISINPDGGFDPSVDSLVSVNGTFNGNAYASTDFAPGDEFVLMQAPSTFFSPKTCAALAVTGVYGLTWGTMAQFGVVTAPVGWVGWGIGGLATLAGIGCI